MTHKAAEDLEEVRRQALIEGATPEAILEASRAAIKVTTEKLESGEPAEMPTLQFRRYMLGVLGEIDNDLQIALDKLKRREERRRGG